MISLDMRTIIFSNMLTSTICILVTLLLWRQSHRRFWGMGFWVFDFVFQTVAFFLIILRGEIPDWLSMVLSNTLLIAGAILGYLGLERFVGKKSSQLHNLAMLVSFVAIQAYFALIQPNLPIRAINVSLYFLIICFQCMWLLLHRVEPDMRDLTFGVGLVFAFYCLAGVARITAIIVGSYPATHFLRAGVFESLMLISYQVLFVLLTFSLILMVNKRLHKDVHIQEEKFSKAFDSSPYAIILTRLSNGQMEEVNDAFLKMTGYRLEEVIGRTAIELGLWDQEEYRATLLKELSESGKVGEREFQFRNRTGEIVIGIYSGEILSISGQKYVLSSINNITDRKRVEEDRERLILELKNALTEVKTLRGFIPICASCKKIRDDEGYWQQVEKYVSDRTEAQFSHGICPECIKKLYPDIASKIIGNR